jgi:hypothetical protein
MQVYSTEFTCRNQIRVYYSVGMSMGRPRKNRDNLVGRAGRQAIEQEDLQRESQKWTRRKATLARFAQ